MNATRKTKLRTKTGCLTCRQRRKKCDEKLPLCINCSSSGRDCQWPTSADLHDRRYASHSQWRYRLGLLNTPETMPDQCHLSRRPPASPAHTIHRPRVDVYDRAGPAVPALELDSSPLTYEGDVVQRALSKELELQVSRHFVEKFYSLLLLPRCHIQYHDGWLSKLWQTMATHKSLYYSILACTASHISLIDASSHMKHIALHYYTNSLKELSTLLATVSQPGDDGLLMTIMMLSIHGFTSWDNNLDSPRHINAAMAILTLRVLDRRTSLSRLFDRLAIESVMYGTFITTTSLWSDVTGSDYIFDDIFWCRAENALDQTMFFPENEARFNSPVLGISVSFFRIALFLRQAFRDRGSPDPTELHHVQKEVADWEGLLLADQNFLGYPLVESEGGHCQWNYYKSAGYLFMLVASLLLEQILQGGIAPGLPRTVPPSSWQMTLAARVLQKYVDDEGWAKCFIGQWPIYTLGVLMESPQDQCIVRNQLQRSCDITGFAEVRRFSCDLEYIWAAREVITST